MWVRPGLKIATYIQLACLTIFTIHTAFYYCTTFYLHVSYSSIDNYYRKFRSSHNISFGNSLNSFELENKLNIFRHIPSLQKHLFLSSKCPLSIALSSNIYLNAVNDPIVFSSPTRN